MGTWVLLALFAVRQLPAQSGLRIVSPASGLVARRGQTVTVEVIVPSGSSYTMVGLVGTQPLGFSEPVLQAPYRFHYQIPATAPFGTYGLTAIGARVAGEPEYSTPIEIVVEPAARPKR